MGHAYVNYVIKIYIGWGNYLISYIDSLGAGLT